MPPLVCLITPGHIASTPRLVKNADTLAAAGYRVHVIAGRHFAPVDPLDAEITSRAAWSFTLVDYDDGPPATVRKILRMLTRRFVRVAQTATVRMAARAHHAESMHLAAVAARQRAQFFFGHCLAGLPAAAFAARRRRAPYGFDAEDFHDAETAEALASGAERTSRRLLQGQLLPDCKLVTAASPLIARQLTKVYAAQPIVLLNVFPRSHAPAAPVSVDPVSPARPARFYWFSQTIGSGRGLEAMIAIAARMRTAVEIQLRGFVSADYERSLARLATASSARLKISFLPPASPTEMARLAAAADLGLSIEESFPPNRDLCLTNKIFVYLLAGIPQLLSRTTAQAALAPAIGSAALLCDLAHADESAQALDSFFSDPERVASARRTAWELAQRRYCWDVEQNVLLESMRRIVPL